MVQRADERTRAQIDVEGIAASVESAFAAHLERQRRVREGEQTADGGTTPIVPSSDDLLQRSVQASVKLGEKLAVETARANRLEQEAEALRRLSRSL